MAVLGTAWFAALTYAAALLVRQIHRNPETRLEPPPGDASPPEDRPATWATPTTRDEENGRAKSSLDGSLLDLAIASFAWCALVAHVAVAFDRLHGWSHDAAWRHTAERLENWFGVYDGTGVWANYAVIVLWGVDLAFDWWRRFRKSHAVRILRESCPRLSAPKPSRLSGPESSGLPSHPSSAVERPARWQVAIRLFVAFMQFQATLVFGGPPTRLVGLAFLVLYGALAWRSPRHWSLSGP